MLYNPTVSGTDNLKSKVFADYKLWRGGGGVYSPALKEKVYFTLAGWNHIVGNYGKHRSVNDIYRRLKLLPLAKDIISRAGTIQSVRTVKGVTSYGLDSIETINVNGVNKVTKVRVVIVNTKTGKKFFSIMDRKIR